MRRTDNGRWMLAMFVVAALVVPGVVAAKQQAQTGPARAASADLVEEEAAAELFLEAAPGVGMCFNRTCTTSAQCKTWCDELSAFCAPVDFPPHYNRCHLP